MTRSRRFHVRVCLVGTLLATFSLRFDDVVADEPDTKTRAQELFLDGRKAIDDGDWTTGCPKVRQSLELFAVANSHFTVAQCDEREGRISGALDHWERGVALVDDRNDPRTKVAKDHIAVLEPRVPRIRVVVPPASASAVILMDGSELAASTLVAPLRVEPGKHVFVVRARGRQDFRREIKVGERERTEFVANVGAPIVSGPAPSATGSGTTAPPDEPVPPSAPMHPRKVGGFVVGGIGAASLLVSAGTAFGVQAAAECKKSGSCTADEISKFQSLYIANGVTFGVGLIGVGVGLAMILTAPKTVDKNAAHVFVVPFGVPAGAGIGLAGRF